MSDYNFGQRVSEALDSTDNEAVLKAALEQALHALRRENPVAANQVLLSFVALSTGERVGMRLGECLDQLTGCE